MRAGRCGASARNAVGRSAHRKPRHTTEAAPQGCSAISSVPQGCAGASTRAFPPPRWLSPEGLCQYTRARGCASTLLSVLRTLRLSSPRMCCPACRLSAPHSPAQRSPSSWRGALPGWRAASGRIFRAGSPKSPPRCPTCFPCRARSATTAGSSSPARSCAACSAQTRFSCSRLSVRLSDSFPRPSCRYICMPRSMSARRCLPQAPQPVAPSSSPPPDHRASPYISFCISPEYCSRRTVPWNPHRRHGAHG